MSARDKLVDQGIEALARTGPRAIGAFVRAWLITLVSVSAVASLVIEHMDGELYVNGQFNVVMWLLGTVILCFPLALPVAIVIAIAHIALKW